MFKLKFVSLVAASSLLLCCGTSGASEFAESIHASFNAPGLAPTEIFKLRDGVELHWFEPEEALQTGANPCLINIHGGSWTGGRAQGYYPWCRYLAEHGVSAFTLKYRLANEEAGIKPTVCVEDAKTAIRWVRANAARLGIDPQRIAAGGTSAGGHLSAALATIEGYNHPDDDLSVSCRPNLLLLVCPVLDNGPRGYANGHIIGGKPSKDVRVADFWEDFSPLHNLNDQLPDTLAMIGERDPLIRVESMEAFGQAVRAAGSDFEWWIFPGEQHSFTTRAPVKMHLYYAHHAFLAKHGYMEPPLPGGDDVNTLMRRQELKPLAQSSQKKVYVVLLGGQSNAAGFGYHQYLVDQSHPLAVPQDDVEIYAGRAAFPQYANKLTKLQSGFGTPHVLKSNQYPELIGTDGIRNHFGPELSLGRTVRDGIDRPDSKLVIIKYAYGGSTLYKHWKGDGTADSSSDAQLYRKFQSTVKAGLEAIEAKYPDYTVEIIGMAWVQGESDALHATKKDDPSIAAGYEAHLKTFIADLRTTFEPDMVFALSMLSTNQSNNPYWPTIRTAQAAVAASDPRVIATETEGPRYLTSADFTEGGLHYLSPALLQIGEDLGRAILRVWPQDADGAALRD